MLEIKDLSTNFNTYEGKVQAIKGVSFKINKGEIFGLVGETGSGKSVTCYSALKLLPKSAEIMGGHVILNGEDITEASERRMREIRGGEIGIIFQDPLSALNPVMKVSEQIGEVLRLHRDDELVSLSEKENIPLHSSKKFALSPGTEFTIWAFCLSFFLLFTMIGQFSFGLPFLIVISLFLIRDYVQKDNPESALDIMVIDSLSKVKLPNPKQIAESYPHELSGGMQQRVMIAMALAGDAKMLIADEPTTALDVTIQAQILQLIKDIQKENNMSVLLITHDLGVVAETCDRVAVMQSGKIVEESTVDKIFSNPSHPYTKSLLAAIPKGGKERLKVKKDLGVI